MNVPVRVAGQPRVWRLLESSALLHWLSRDPWLTPTAPLVVQVAYPQRDGFREELPGLVRRYASPDDAPRLDFIDEALCRRGAREGLRAWMAIGSNHPRHLADALAHLGQGRVRLLVFSLPPETVEASWLDELRGIVDIYTKLPNPGMILVLVLLTGTTPTADAVRLDLAWPVQATRVADNADRWSAYLHERVAWFSGGDLTVAIQVGAELPPLKTGDDRSLEKAMDEHASAMLAELEPELCKRLLRDTRSFQFPPRLQLTTGLSGPEAHSIRPTPWLARALLLAKPEHPQRRFLAAMSGCRPLAMRLLGRCMDLEQRIRDQLAAAHPDGPSGDSASRRLSHIKRDPNAIEHRITPLGQLPNLDPWQHSSLADIINSSDIHKKHRQAMHDLRRIRNALAHGSPVGWGAITILDRLETRLA